LEYGRGLGSAIAICTVFLNIIQMDEVGVTDFQLQRI
jgi:hypothetical protein